MSFDSFSFGRKQRNTPGPGSYSIPSNFGDGPKYSFRDRPKEKISILEPPMLFLPSTLNGGRTSFGGRTKPPQAFNETPGPKYDIRKDFDKNLPKITIHVRTESPPNEIPSPTAYNVPRSIKPKKVTISSGKRTDLVDHQQRPCPGKYALPSDFDKHKNLTISPYYQAEVYENGVPGPGYYETTTLTGKDAPRFTFSKAKLNDNNKKRSKSSFSQSPGPADYYNAYKIIGGQDSNSKIPYSIGRKGRTPDFVDKHDYPFHDVNRDMVSKSVTIGYRPEMCYENASPGPIYDTRTDIGGKKISIGSLTKIPTPENISPSPDYYFKAPLIIPNQEPFKGFVGPSSREPDEIKRDKWIPSPTQYNTNTDSHTFGFTIGNRQLDDFHQDFDAPYGPPISTFSGPKYTIGKKTEDFV